jgi:hypothetical protein
MCSRASLGSNERLSVFYESFFFFFLGFAPIPVETAGSAPTATSSSEELAASAASAVQPSAPRHKEDPAPTAQPSPATPQKINGEIEYKVSCPISMISRQGCFLPIIISKYTCYSAVNWYT